MSPEDRRELAAESITKVPVIANNPARTQVIASLHQRLLCKTQHVEEPSTNPEEVTPAETPQEPAQPLVVEQRAAPQASEERALTLLAGALVAIIIAILLRKCVAGLDLLTGHESRI